MEMQFAELTTSDLRGVSGICLVQAHSVDPEYPPETVQRVAALASRKTEDLVR